ncbi:hypothetical protein [Streptomyces qinglanensis]|uniref:hypothetical protein n=1 Tax=Streptomyces qinglanensis TaxID=943816 RepID=UPI003798FE14
MLILRGDLADCFAGLFGSACPAEQSDKTVECVAVAVRCAFVERDFHPAFAQRAVEPTAGMDVHMGQFRELCESSGVGE